MKAIDLVNELIIAKERLSKLELIINSDNVLAQEYINDIRANICNIGLLLLEATREAEYEKNSKEKK